ncbi:hypothetical protein BK716_28500 [Bacillus thuringiensis serovar higo]|uniref:Uncharacterized protein n=1 Tax=Bacillus thuringiensis subsp. higo TaxID=132266 RepID=A0A9X6LEN1_BACUH|nr:hypothetical protein BK716_28500 [Bacillus thuringiensis serovar higo]
MTPRPSWIVKTETFWPANRRGSPSRNEGLGSWINGVWGSFPQWVWATPKVEEVAMLAWFGIADKRGIGGNPRQAVFAPQSG